MRHRLQLTWRPHPDTPRQPPPLEAFLPASPCRTGCFVLYPVIWGRTPAGYSHTWVPWTLRAAPPPNTLGPACLCLPDRVPLLALRGCAWHGVHGDKGGLQDHFLPLPPHSWGWGSHSCLLSSGQPSSPQEREATINPWWILLAHSQRGWPPSCWDTETWVSAMTPVPSSPQLPSPLGLLKLLGLLTMGAPSRGVGQTGPVAPPQD